MLCVIHSILSFAIWVQLSSTCGACAQTRERGDMLYEERLEAAERLRLAGNALFTAGDATEAMGKCGAGVGPCGDVRSGARQCDKRLRLCF